MAQANISVSTLGDNTIVPGGVNGLDGNPKRTQVSYLSVEFGGAVTVQIKDGASNVLATFDITAAGGSAIFEKKSEDSQGRAGQYVFRCAPGNAFIINLSAAVSCKGTIQYVRR